MGSTSDIIRASIAVATGGLSETTGATETYNAGARAKAGIESPAKGAKDAADAQKREADRLASDAALRRSNDEAVATATSASSSARARQLARGNQGRRSTILTGPLGVIDDPTAARKSILGA